MNIHSDLLGGLSGDAKMSEATTDRLSCDTIQRVQDVYRLYEGPLGKVGEVFWEKNIPTFYSHGHLEGKKPGEEGACFILIDYDELSYMNKKIAHQIIDQIHQTRAHQLGPQESDLSSSIYTRGSGRRILRLSLQVRPENTFRSVQQWFMTKADQFKSQEKLEDIEVKELYDLLDEENLFVDDPQFSPADPENYTSGIHPYTKTREYVRKEHLRTDFWLEKGYVYSDRCQRFFHSQADLEKYHAILDDRAREVE